MTVEQMKDFLVAEGHAVVPTGYLKEVTAEAVVQARELAHWLSDPETYHAFHIESLKKELGIEAMENAAIEITHDALTGALHLKAGLAMFVPTIDASEVPSEGPTSPVPMPGSKPARITSKRS